MTASVFGTRLKQARLLARLSQKQLGIRAGMDQFVASTRVNRYELGVHQPDYATAQRLANVLGVPTPFLYADGDQLAEVILAFAFTDSATRDRLTALIRGAVGLIG